MLHWIKVKHQWTCGWNSWGWSSDMKISVRLQYFYHWFLLDMLLYSLKSKNITSISSLFIDTYAWACESVNCYSVKAALMMSRVQDENWWAVLYFIVVRYEQIDYEVKALFSTFVSSILVSGEHFEVLGLMGCTNSSRGKRKGNEIKETQRVQYEHIRKKQSGASSLAPFD